MSNEDFAGAIFLSGYDYETPDRVMCDGRFLVIINFNALYSLVGTHYGGDGRVNFAVPDLRGRAPVAAGAGPNLPSHEIGQRFGRETETLKAAVPEHTHTASFSADKLNPHVTSTVADSDIPASGTLRCNSTVGGLRIPTNNVPGWANAASEDIFAPTDNGALMAPNPVVPTVITPVSFITSFANENIPVETSDFSGEAQPVTATTMPPATVARYSIVTEGIYPPRS